jgi:aspartyl-tRNA(Asn)/glutamyl-tRNA(Gln) amidotransferase subunit A
MSDLANISLVEAVEAISRREVTSTSLLESCLANIVSDGGVTNAVVWEDRESAFAAAEAADKQVDAKLPLGLLHGIPLAHKDMFYQAGRISACGSPIRANFTPEFNATVIEKLNAAGAYAFGGLNMTEFAQGGTGHNRHYGNCRNPWRSDYVTGGSSSGSGAAVASRFTYAALGSDTGGSIRIPASANGVSGIKPTQTRVSRYGAMPLSFSMDNVGPLARSARDCARMLKVIAGYDSRDPTSARNPVPDYEAALNGDLRGVYIGVPRNYFLDNVDVPVQAAFDRSLAVLAHRGASIVPISLPLMDAIIAYSFLVLRSEAASYHSDWLRAQPQDYSSYVGARLFSILSLPATLYLEAMRRRGSILKAFAAEVFTEVDLIVTPTIRSCLPTLQAADVESGGAAAEAVSAPLAMNSRAFNYLGLPAMSIPCGFDPNGLPIGLQIAGRPFAEADVLRAGDAFQQDTDWHLRQPAKGGRVGAEPVDAGSFSGRLT